MVEVVVGVVVGLRWWNSVVIGVRSDRYFRCSCPVGRNGVSYRNICSRWSGHGCSGMQNVVKWGKNRMSLSSCYQAGGACRHIKQTTVMLIQPPKVQVKIHVVTITLIPKVSCYM